MAVFLFLDPRTMRFDRRYYSCMVVFVSELHEAFVQGWSIMFTGEEDQPIVIRREEGPTLSKANGQLNLNRNDRTGSEQSKSTGGMNMSKEFTIFENEEKARAKIDELEDKKLFPHPAFDSRYLVAKKHVVAKKGEESAVSGTQYEIFALTKDGTFEKYQEG